ncbi:MAG: type II secretion system F family protein, partial [Planctomycetota bacterium]
MNAPRFRLKQLAGLCRRLGTSLEAGVDVRRTLSRETQSAKGRYQQTLSEVTDRIKKGETFTESIKDTGEAFPQLMHDLVSVGEQTGKLDHVLLRLADHFDGMLRLRGIFLAGIAWPAIQLVLAIGVIGLMILIMGMIPGNSDWDPLGWGLKGVSGLIYYLICVGSIFAVGAVLIVNWSRGKMGAQFVWPLIDRVPMLGKCIRTMALSRIAWTMSLTNDTPMDALAAMDASLRASGNPIYSQLQQPVRDSLMEGNTMHEALSATNEFPHEFLDTLLVGEETGQVSESLHKLSQQYESQTEVAAKTLTVFGSIMVWGFVAMLI